MKTRKHVKSWRSYWRKIGTEFGWLGLIFLFSMLVALPNWVKGFYPHGHDSIWHAQWAFHFSNQFMQGELYPRWLMDMNGGLGSPAFFYYPPVPYWITSLIRLVCPGDMSVWRLLGYSATLGMILSAWTAFFFLRSLVNKSWTAFMGACLYLIMPFHSTVDLYQRCAFAEFWAFAWLPLILFFVRRLQQGRSKAWLGLALNYALLIMMVIEFI
jgi:uncharacterized membrane protein